MRAFEHLLVPTDFSEPSRLAAEYALHLAQPLGASIDLLHVLEFPDYIDAWSRLVADKDDTEQLERLARRRAQSALAAFAGALPKVESVEVRTRLEEGELTQTLLEATQPSRCDLVVTGTHGRTGLSRVLLGNVAEKLVRYSECPVLTVRHAAQGGYKTGGWTDPQELVNRILVPVDLSPHSFLAARRALALAQAFGAGVTLLHVVQHELAVVAYAEDDDPSLFQERVEPLARRELTRFREGLTVPPGVRASGKLRFGEPRAEVLEELRSGSYDLVVMGTHGRSGFELLLLGSVTAGVVRRSPVPVLTVRTRAAEA